MSNVSIPWYKIMINNYKLGLLCFNLLIFRALTYFKFSNLSFLTSGIWLHQFSGRFVRLLLTMFKQEERCPGSPQTNHSPGVRNVHRWINRLHPGRREACQGGGGLPGGSFTAVDTRISFPRTGTRSSIKNLSIFFVLLESLQLDTLFSKKSLIAGGIQMIFRF